MADEEKFRLEEPEEKIPEEEKKGLFAPLPTVEKKTKIKEGRPQPIVRFLGIEMYENQRELIVVILMPFLAALIDVGIFSFVEVNRLGSSSTYLFFLPAIAAIPIGLVVAETGKSLIGGFLCSIYFVIIYIVFLTTPALLSPNLEIGGFIIGGISFSIGYFVLVSVASILGSVIGTIIREFA